MGIPPSDISPVHDDDPIVIPPMSDRQHLIYKANVEILQYHWPFIREGLNWVRNKTERYSNVPMGFWQPQHIAKALSVDPPSAELWIGTHKDGSNTSEPLAFVVTQMQMEPFLQVFYSMFIWIAYKRPNYATNIVGEIENYLCMVARSRQLEWLEAMTRRPGLLRRLERYGWKEHMKIIRKPLWEG